MPWEVAGDLMRNIRDIYKVSPELDQMTRAGAQVGGFGGVDAGDILRKDLGQLPGISDPSGNAWVLKVKDTINSLQIVNLRQ